VSVGHGCSICCGAAENRLDNLNHPRLCLQVDFGEAQAAALCSKAMNTEAGQDKPDNARFELDYQLSLP